MNLSKDIIRCSDCVEGIICHDCYKRLPNNQRNICPICRKESEDFKIDVKETNNDNEISSYDCKKIMETIIFFSTIILLSYLFGMLIVEDVTNTKSQNFDIKTHITSFVVGLVLMGCICYCLYLRLSQCK
jgi:Na+/glutamate symporter